jgi:hypothetical protein
MKSLGELLREEQARVKKVLDHYKEIGTEGEHVALIIEQSLRQADQAAASGDSIAMLRSYEDLKGIE